MKFKETKFYKWLDNFWYHYKWITLIISLFAVFIIISTVQMVTREEGDIYVMYAGPEVISVQNMTYIERAFELLDDSDYSGDGEVNTVLRDLTIMSAEEIEAQARAEMEKNGVANEGYILNEQMARSQMSQNLQVFNQEILGGDSVICLLSPYTYSIVYEAGGFMSLEEVLGYKPEYAYDDCSIRLSDIDFGKLEGLATLPEDTLFCIRRVSSMSFLKGQEKTSEAHEYHVDKFKLALNYVKTEENAEN
ncbi:MAG: hypothetical protein IJ391_01780 [Clostridia bacterium]|nr:hypothetical protein [Clostridia bacterium]